MRWSFALGLSLASALTLALAGAPSWAKGGPCVMYSGLKFGSDGGASLRIELSASARVLAKEQGKTTRFLIDGATVERKNNLNPLDASFFCSNLLRAKLDRRKEGVFVTLELRDALPVEHKVVPFGEGAVVEFRVPGPRSESARCR